MEDSPLCAIPALKAEKEKETILVNSKNQRKASEGTDNSGNENTKDFCVIASHIGPKGAEIGLFREVISMNTKNEPLIPESNKPLIVNGVNPLISTETMKDRPLSAPLNQLKISEKQVNPNLVCVFFGYFLGWSLKRERKK